MKFLFFLFSESDLSDTFSDAETASKATESHDISCASVLTSVNTQISRDQSPQRRRDPSDHQNREDSNPTRKDAVH